MRLKDSFWPYTTCDTACRTAFFEEVLFCANSNDVYDSRATVETAASAPATGGGGIAVLEVTTPAYVFSA